MDGQGPEQRAKGFRLPHHGFAVQAHADEVVHRLDVILFEGLPGRAQDVALLSRQAPLFGQILDAAFDLGPQAFELGRRWHQRARIPRECRLQGGGIEKRDALHPAFLAHEPARDLRASHRALVFEPDHVIDQREADRLRLVGPKQLRLADDLFGLPLFLNQGHFKLDLDGQLGD